MAKMLVVHHDVDVADIEADRLRKAGHEVQQCAGPVGGNLCPVQRGEHCWQVDWADVVVYDAWISGEGEPVLIEELRELYPDKPIMTLGGQVLRHHPPAPQHQKTATW